MELGKPCPFPRLQCPFLLNKIVGLAVIYLEIPMAIEKKMLGGCFESWGVEEPWVWRANYELYTD